MEAMLYVEDLVTMDEEFDRELQSNGRRFQTALERIIDKNSKLQYGPEAIEVDLDNTPLDTLEHYMTLSEKSLDTMETTTSADLREESLQDPTKDSVLDHTCEERSEVNYLGQITMDDEVKRQLQSNGRRFQTALERIIEKYSKLQYGPDAIEVDLDNTPLDMLEHYMTLSEKSLDTMETTTSADLREESLQDPTKDSVLDHTCEERSEVNYLGQITMDEEVKRQLQSNGRRFQTALERIIEKYSKLQYGPDAIEVDLDNTPLDMLEHYMTLSEKSLDTMETTTSADLREESLQDPTKDSVLDHTI